MPNNFFNTMRKNAKKSITAVSNTAKESPKLAVAKIFVGLDKAVGPYIGTTTVVLNTLLPLFIGVDQQMLNTILHFAGSARMKGIALNANVFASAPVIGTKTLNVPLTIPAFEVPFNITSNIAQLLNIHDQVPQDTKVMISILSVLNAFHLLRKGIIHWAKEVERNRRVPYPAAYAAIYIAENVSFWLGYPILMNSAFNHFIYTGAAQPGSELFSKGDSRDFKNQTNADPLSFSILSQTVTLGADANTNGGIDGRFNVSMSHQDNTQAHQAYILMIFAGIMLGVACLLRFTRFVMDYGLDPVVNQTTHKSKKGKRTIKSEPDVRIVEEHTTSKSEGETPSRIAQLEANHTKAKKTDESGKSGNPTKTRFFKPVSDGPESVKDRVHKLEKN